MTRAKKRSGLPPMCPEQNLPALSYCAYPLHGYTEGEEKMFRTTRPLRSRIIRITLAIASRRKRIRENYV